MTTQSYKFAKELPLLKETIKTSVDVVDLREDEPGTPAVVPFGSIAVGAAFLYKDGRKNLIAVKTSARAVIAFNAKGALLEFKVPAKEEVQVASLELSYLTYDRTEVATPDEPVEKPVAKTKGVKNPEKIAAKKVAKAEAKVEKAVKKVAKAGTKVEEAKAKVEQVKTKVKPSNSASMAFPPSTKSPFSSKVNTQTGSTEEGDDEGEGDE